MHVDVRQGAAWQMALRHLVTWEAHEGRVAAVRWHDGTVAQLACGDGHGLVVTAEGTLVALGRGDRGQLGIGRCVATAPPCAVDVGSHPVQCVSAGDVHSACVTVDGSVWTWGADGGDGRLGFALAQGETVAVPTVLARERLGDQAAVGVACGADFTVILLAGGSVVAFGRGDKGQLGNGSTANALVPQAVLIPPVSAVAAGTAHVAALSRGGEVFVWGRLGRGAVPLAVQLPSSAGRPVAVAAGGDGVAVMTDHAQVWTWSWTASDDDESVGVTSAPARVLPFGQTAGLAPVDIALAKGVLIVTVADGSCYVLHDKAPAVARRITALDTCGVALVACGNAGLVLAACDRASDPDTGIWSPVTGDIDTGAVSSSGSLPRPRMGSPVAASPVTSAVVRRLLGVSPTQVTPERQRVVSCVSPFELDDEPEPLPASAVSRRGRPSDLSVNFSHETTFFSVADSPGEFDEADSLPAEFASPDSASPRSNPVPFALRAQMTPRNLGAALSSMGLTTQTSQGETLVGTVHALERSRNVSSSAEDEYVKMRTLARSLERENDELRGELQKASVLWSTSRSDLKMAQVEIDKLKQERQRLQNSVATLRALNSSAESGVPTTDYGMPMSQGEQDLSAASSGSTISCRCGIARRHDAALYELRDSNAGLKQVVTRLRHDLAAAQAEREMDKMEYNSAFEALTGNRRELQLANEAMRQQQQVQMDLMRQVVDRTDPATLGVELFMKLKVFVYPVAADRKRDSFGTSVSDTSFTST